MPNSITEKLIHFYMYIVSVLVGKPEGRTPLQRPRRRWEDNIKTNLRKVGWGHELDQSGLGWAQVAGSCKRGNEPSVL